MTTPILRLAILGLLASGCVSKQKYTDLQDRYDALKLAYTDVAVGYQMDRQVLEARIDALQMRNAELARFYRDIVDTFGEDMSNGDVAVVVYPDRIALQLAHDVTFGSGSADLSEAGRARMDKLATLLKKHGDRAFQVEGHTDAEALVPGADYDDNWELGAARALAVVDQLIAEGVKRDQLSAATFADTEPVAPNTSADGRQMNRRVEISLRPSLDEVPGHRAILWHASRLDAEEQVEPSDPVASDDGSSDSAGGE